MSWRALVKRCNGLQAPRKARDSTQNEFGMVIMMLFLVPGLVGPTYSWVYFSFALCLWLYSTFDNVDGKQARGTISSSPLGDLFDVGMRQVVTEAAMWGHDVKRVRVLVQWCWILPPLVTEAARTGGSEEAGGGTRPAGITKLPARCCAVFGEAVLGCEA